MNCLPGRHQSTLGARADVLEELFDVRVVGELAEVVDFGAGSNRRRSPTAKRERTAVRTKRERATVLARRRKQAVVHQGRAGHARGGTKRRRRLVRQGGVGWWRQRRRARADDTATTKVDRKALAAV